MNSATDRILLTEPFSVRLQRFLWLHPEWWAMMLCSIGWYWMVQHAHRFAAHGRQK